MSFKNRLDKLKNAIKPTKKLFTFIKLRDNTYINRIGEDPITCEDIEQLKQEQTAQGNIEPDIDIWIKASEYKKP